MIECRVCGETKPKEEFTRGNRCKHIQECADCQRERLARDRKTGNKLFLRNVSGENKKQDAEVILKKRELDDRKFAIELERIEKECEL